jgi:DeoR/GlpR family transcriptional regulator of sugar metabolism
LAILEAFPEANKAKLAEKFNVSQRTIRRWANEG